MKFLVGLGWVGLGWVGLGWVLGKHPKAKRSLLEYLSRKPNFLRIPNQYSPYLNFKTLYKSCGKKKSINFLLCEKPR